MTTHDMKTRSLVFAGLVALCLVASVVAVVAFKGQTRPAAVGDIAVDPGEGPTAAPSLVFKNLKAEDGSDHLGWVRLNDLEERVATELPCERLYFAGDRGLCAMPSPDKAGFIARMLDKDLNVTHDVPFPGYPSRVRISDNGQYGVITAFITGESYADARFVTRTTIYDMAAGKAITDLEAFATFHNGRRIDAPDVNYWGVTFEADNDHFFATLATGKQTHLIRGAVSTRTAETLHQNVECPSLSPDGKRIGYKKLVGANGQWRFHVLELSSKLETPLAEPRSIDDQLEWLDNHTVMYGALEDGHLWRLPADGTGTPSQYLDSAASPAVLRPIREG